MLHLNKILKIKWFIASKLFGNTESQILSHKRNSFQTHQDCYIQYFQYQKL